MRHASVIQRWRTVVLTASKLLVVWFFAIATVVFFLCYFEIGAVLGRGVTKEGLLALRPGMAEKEVLALLGSPLCEGKDYGPAQEGQKYPWLGTWTWTYGKPSPLLLGAGLEIYLKMKDGVLASVYVEHYDLGVYKCDIRECPKIWKPWLLDRLPRKAGSGPQRLQP